MLPTFSAGVWTGNKIARGITPNRPCRVMCRLSAVRHRARSHGHIADGRRCPSRGRRTVSRWLTSGVPATQVARRAERGVRVLLKVYAHCIDGQANEANKRINDALRASESQPDPADEGDGEDEQAS
jgi:hypothetical protein